MDDDRSIGILAYDGVDAHALVGVHDALVAAIRAGCEYSVTVFSLVPSDVVTAASGIGVVPDDVLIGTPDVVVIPGGWSDGDRGPTYPSELHERAGQLADAGATMVGIGTGALALGEAGLLAGHPATTAPQFRDALADYAETVESGPVVGSENVITATGSGAALAVVRQLLREDCNEGTLDRVATELAME